MNTTHKLIYKPQIYEFFLLYDCFERNVNIFGFKCFNHVQLLLIFFKNVMVNFNKSFLCKIILVCQIIWNSIYLTILSNLNFPTIILQEYNMVKSINEKIKNNMILFSLSLSLSISLTQIIREPTKIS